MKTSPFWSNVAVASKRPTFIDGVEAAGAKEPFGAGVGVGVGVGLTLELELSPPHPEASRTAARKIAAQYLRTLVMF
jgi:hypothetical protein